MFGVGVTELLILFLVTLVINGPGLFAVIDAALLPTEAWTAANQNKALWLVMLAGACVICGLGLALGLAYLIAIRPKVSAQAKK